MDDLRLGATVRKVRIRRGWRQMDLAKRAATSTSTISRIERGHVETLSLATIRRVLAALEIRLDLVPRWRGGDLDRLLNVHHSRLHELVAIELRAHPGWTFQPEVSFAFVGERGVIDILAFHRERRVVLVIELKTNIVDVNELVGTLDRKTRLARRVAAERWTIPGDPSIATWLIVASSRTNRRRVQAHGTMLRTAFPSDGRSIGGWLARPSGPVRCLSFWPDSRPGSLGPTRTSVRRVRAQTPRVE
jgi:transcriptional regulator with XRE-family HTH domain